MKQRVITGILLVVFLLIIGVIDNPYLIKLVVSGITILGMIEAKKLFNVDDKNVFYFLSILSVLSIVISPFLIGIIGVLGVASYISYFQKDINLISISLYPFLPFMMLSALYLKTSILVIGWLILVVALTDSLAYFVGKSIGKKFIKKGFCKTSPNKSWEGVIGGVFFGVLIGGILGLKLFSYNSFLFAFLISISGVFGDLFESFLKRRAGVKDSGDILPGHGGILDRTDAYLFAAPLMFVLIGSL